jgi:hypothetical protein
MKQGAGGRIDLYTIYKIFLSQFRAEGGYLWLCNSLIGLIYNYLINEIVYKKSQKTHTVLGTLQAYSEKCVEDPKYVILSEYGTVLPTVNFLLWEALITDEQHHQFFCSLPLKGLIWYKISQRLVFTVGKYNIEMIYKNFLGPNCPQGGFLGRVVGVRT